MSLYMWMAALLIILICPAQARKKASRVDEIGIQMVPLPGGRFHMGSTSGHVDERPVHMVAVQDFSMSKTEITVAQYKACVEAGACTTDDLTRFDTCNWGKPERADHPINCVNWHQATAFASWVGGRLPTEAEWEYAARSGGKKRIYPWGDADAICGRAVMEDGHHGCRSGSTFPVCSKTEGNTEQGLCDMAGNVWEWVEDIYGFYGEAPTDGTTRATRHAKRVGRGGGWYYGARHLRVTARDRYAPDDRFDALGFRIVVSNL